METSANLGKNVKIVSLRVTLCPKTHQTYDVFLLHGAVMDLSNVEITVMSWIVLNAVQESSSVRQDNALKATRSVMGLTIVMIVQMRPIVVDQKNLCALTKKEAGESVLIKTRHNLGLFVAFLFSFDTLFSSNEQKLNYNKEERYLLMELLLYINIAIERNV